MASGLVDAACASEYADSLLSPDQQSDIEWIAETSPIPAHVVVARPGLEDHLKQPFVEQMLSLNEPENRHLLAYLYGPDGYVTTEPAVYEGVREIARRYGLLS